MSDGLSAEEVRAFATVFADPVSARHVLETAGLPRDRHPSWVDSNAGLFWFEVSGLLTAGALVDGRAAVLAVAKTLFPGNPVFAAGAAAAPAGTSVGGVVLVWGVPWPRNPNFVGRAEELAGLRGRLAGVGSVSVLPQALHGLGGVGKTQLAVEYAHRYRDVYDVVWWVNADQPGDLVAGLAGLAGRLGVAVAVETAESVVRVVEALGARQLVARWLVVVDNAGAPSDLHGLLAAAGGGGHVLVTSRDPGWAGVAWAVAVDVLPRGDAVGLLRRRAPQLSAAEADQIAELLGDLPLAVEQAGAWLGRVPMPVETYLSLVRERTREILAEGTPSAYPVPVAATWTVAVEGLDDAAAVCLLRLWAHCGPEPIPHDLVGPSRDGLPAVLGEVGEDPLAWGRLVETVSGLGLVKVVAGGLVMHRLVQAVLRDHIPAGEREGLGRAVHVLLAAACDGLDPHRPGDWPKWAALLPHTVASGMADGEEDARGVMNRLVLYLSARGDYGAAVDQATGLLDRWRTALGEDHPSTVLAMANLAASLWDLGELGRARELEERVLADRRRLLGEDHPDTVLAMANLARSLADLGELGRARELEERVLADRRRLLGEDHPDTVLAMANLAASLNMLGELGRARELRERALADYRRLLGEDHPDTVLAMANLARSLADLGEPGRARELEERVLADRRRLLGEDHPSTVRARANLAASLADLGEPGRARELEERVLADRRRLLGEDHPDTVLAMANLARSLADLGELGRARELEERVLADRRRLLGEDHPSTLTAAHNLAFTPRDQGDYAAARAMFDDVLARRRALLGEDHPDTVVVRRALADIESADP